MKQDAKTQLILEGGGMRGVYTTGVLDFFLENNLLFYNIVGVSAGACHATSYVSRQIGRSFRIAKEYSGDKRYIDKKGVITKGSLFGMDFIFREIPDELDPFDYETYAQTKTELYAVVTDCNTGEARYLLCNNPLSMNTYMKASSSLPLLAPIVNIDGMELLDGGIADSIPIGFSLKSGFSKQVLVLTRTAGYRKQPNSMMWVIRRAYHRYPKLCKTIEERYLDYNRSLDLAEKLADEGRAFIIRPSRPINFGRAETDPKKLQDLYQLGYMDAQAAYSDLQSFLKQ